ncbi:MAG: hypothetical protein ACFFB0_10160 [Promethearchaeota archaeon]
MVKAAKATEKSLNISKGIVFTFFTFYLIFFGIFISIYFNSPTGGIPLFVSYLPLLCYVGAAFCGIALIIFIRNVTTHKVRQTQSRKKIKAGSVYKQALFLIIFIFAFIPLLSPIIDRGVNNQNFSVYNNRWNGCSEFKRTIEQAGYNVMTVQSSLSTTQRLNQSILLILMGPNMFYDPVFEIPYFIDFFNGRNSLLLCHDHGSTSTLLWEIFVANMLNFGNQNSTGIFPVTIFPNGILRDNASYDTTPEFPVIRTFDYSHPTTSGIDEVILSVASCAAGGPLVEFFGWDVVGSASELYSWVDKKPFNGKVDPEIDVLDLGFIGETLTGFPSELLKLPLYSPFTPHVFLAKEFGNSRVFVSADASLFNNELIDENLGYDNKQFGINIVEWLTYTDLGVDKDNWVVVFDEAHIRPEKSRDLSSAGIYGFIMQYIVHLSTNPITAWIYPLLAVYTLKRYLPKKDKQKEQEKVAEEEEKKEEKARFRTSSFFAQKIEEFKDKAKYGEALLLLYRRLERKLHALLRGEKISTKRVIDMVIAKDPSSTKLKIRRLSRFMDRILAIKEGKYKVRTEDDFEEIFFEMSWAVNNI